MGHVETKRLSDLLDHVYDCVTDPPHWRYVLRTLCDELDLLLGVLGCYVRSQGTPLLRIQHGVSPAYFESMGEYGAEMGTFWGGFERIHSYPVGELVVHSTAQSGYDFSQNRFAREWCMPQGIRDLAAMTISGDAATLSTMTFGSMRLLEQEGTSELELLRLLSPHIRRALGISRILDLKEIALGHLTATFNALPNGLMLLDASARVLYANAAAETVIRANDGLRVTGGRLSLADAQAQAALSCVLVEIAERSKISERGAGIPVRRPGHANMVLHVLPLNYGSMRQALDDRAVAAVFMVSELMETSLPHDALRMLYDLTPAEVRVCEMLVEGLTPAETATGIGVAPSTARSHLLRIFEKTGTSRQAELVRLVTSLQIAKRPAT